MHTFQKVENTDFDNQKGADISICNGEQSSLLNVWVDNIEKDDVRIFVTHENNDELLRIMLDSSEFKLPEISYSEDRSYCYLTFNDVQIHIKLEGEGIIIDAWDMSEPSYEEVLDSTAIEWDEFYGIEY